jgi:hypothetical protein
MLVYDLTHRYYPNLVSRLASPVSRRQQLLTDYCSLGAATRQEAGYFGLCPMT